MTSEHLGSNLAKNHLSQPG